MIYCLQKMKQTHWLLIMLGPQKSHHCQTWNECCLSWNRKLTAKLELNCKIYKSYTKHLESQFLLSELPSELKKFGRCLEYIRSLKKPFGKLSVAQQQVSILILVPDQVDQVSLDQVQIRCLAYDVTYCYNLGFLHTNKVSSSILIKCLPPY